MTETLPRIACCNWCKQENVQELHGDRLYPDSSQRYFVLCQACGRRGPRITESRPDDHGSKIFAITAWNIENGVQPQPSSIELLYITNKHTCVTRLHHRQPPDGPWRCVQEVTLSDDEAQAWIDAGLLVVPGERP